MPLLPNCNQQWYHDWIRGNQDEEGFVNGTWNAILSNTYETSALNYAISPEAHVSTGWIDLLITRNSYEHQQPIGVWQVIYEGKAGNSNDHFPQILDQLQRYADDLNSGRFVYLIGGRGDKAKFWRLTKNLQGNSQTQGISVGAGLVVVFAQDDTAPEYDMVNDQDEISAILKYFFNNQQLPT